jgi:uncharacterized protein YkwD
MAAYVITYKRIARSEPGSQVRNGAVAAAAYGAPVILVSTRTQLALRRLIVLAALAAALAPLAVLSSARASGREGGCANAAEAPEQASLSELRGSMLCLINRIRDRYGLGPLAENVALRRSATGHSNDMVSHRYFSHYGPSGSTVGSRVARAGYLARVNDYFVGENIGGGVGRRFGSPVAVLQEWMHSPPHRANILDREFHDLGVGV